MSEPVSVISSITFLKSIAPSLVGGLLALWRVKDEMRWDDKTTSSKIITLLLTPVVFIVATMFGYYFGGAIIEHLGSVGSAENLYTNAFIMILTTASSLRFLRLFMVKIEEIFTAMFDGVLNLIKSFFRSKQGRFEVDEYTRNGVNFDE